ncbi:hypothetical protein FA13DRAFT_1517815 [Coprinellus micaceus]|uniref:Uncharacterized protein n=1 Tax=Coprinellus micaceus TaxID=71717 RepID=A0A4Y7SKH8_COPMI|nr:hypothetical protein FA13DRAFT_1517815 [Coprinellus micaceus]
MKSLPFSCEFPVASDSEIRVQLGDRSFPSLASVHSRRLSLAVWLPSHPFFFSCSRHPIIPGAHPLPLRSFRFDRAASAVAVRSMRRPSTREFGGYGAPFTLSSQQMTGDG